MDIKEGRKKFQGKYYVGNGHGRDKHKTYIYVKKIVGISENDYMSYADAVFFEDYDLHHTIAVTNKMWYISDRVISNYGYRRITKKEFLQQMRKVDNEWNFESVERWGLLK